MSAFASLARAVRRAADPQRTALLSPQQGVAWSYGELDRRVRSLGRGLREFGFTEGSIAVSDVENVKENLVLQLALSHIGATIATCKNEEALAKLMVDQPNVRGAVLTSADSPFASANLHLPPILLEGAPPLAPGASAVAFAQLAAAPPCDEDAAATADGLLGIYSGAALTHGAAHGLGAAAGAALGVRAGDVSCVSITLCHAFGIGSAVGSALQAGGAVLLPAVGGIRGCGDPKQRAAATRDVLYSSAATLLFADSHTLRGLQALPPPRLPALRGGVCKVGSGSDYLEGVTDTGGASPIPLEYAGKRLQAMGKAP
jgi:acyl-CoA synthetase (AMP-forming)/AMP-acid ligase II